MNADTDFEAFTLELTRTATALLYKLDAATIDEYFEVLRRYPLPRVVQALEAARGTCDFMPRPAEIARLMGVGVEREPERRALPGGPRMLTDGEPERLTVDMIKAGVEALRPQLEEPKRARDPEREREEVAFWERLEAVRRGEHL